MYAFSLIAKCGFTSSSRNKVLSGSHKVAPKAQNVPVRVTLLSVRQFITLRLEHNVSDKKSQCNINQTKKAKNTGMTVQVTHRTFTFTLQKTLQPRLCEYMQLMFQFPLIWVRIRFIKKCTSPLQPIDQIKKEKNCG